MKIGNNWPTWPASAFQPLRARCYPSGVRVDPWWFRRKEYLCMMNQKSRSPIHAGSMTAALGAAVALALVVASAVAIAQPLPVNLPTGTEVSLADTAGVNLLEPANAAIGSAPKENLAS